MKPTNIFTIGLVAVLALCVLDEGLRDGRSGVLLDKAFSLCVLFGVLLQLAVFGSGGASKLRWVSLLWLVVALALASSTTSRLFPLSAVFLAGLLFTFVPPERPLPTD